MNKKSIFALLLCLVMAISLIGCKNNHDPSTEAETTTEAESEPETTAPAEEKEVFISVATGELSGCYNGLFAQSEGDMDIVSLVQPSIGMVTRNGWYTTSAGKTFSSAYQGWHCDYSSVASITGKYNSEDNKTVYTIKLADGAVFSDGSAITADDLIFTLYVVCDPSYDGTSEVADAAIFGLKSYQLNNSAAPGIDVTGSEVSAALASPDEGLKQAIMDRIIRPTLEEERAWCEENWQNYKERGYGDSAEEFFITLYTSTLQSDYKVGSKSFDKILDDTVEMFGVNYKALAKDYQGDVNYFDEKAKEVAKTYLYDTKLAIAGGHEVASISGIKRKNDTTVTVTVLGKRSEEFLKTLGNLSVLSLAYYGDLSEYDYAGGAFGLTRGDLTAIKAKSATPFGYGPYCYSEVKDGAILLEPNQNYPYGQTESCRLRMVCVPTAERVEALRTGSVDVASISLSEDDINNLKAINGGSLSGTTLTTRLVNEEAIYYFGMNSTSVNVGKSDSDASKHMRRAFAILLASERETLCAQYFGEAASVIELPWSSDSWAISSGKETVETAFSTTSDGTAIYTDSMTAEERSEAALAAARKELKLAGFTFGDSGKIDTAPEGSRTAFTALIPNYLIGDNVMTAILSRLQTALDQLGITLDLKEYDDLDEFVVKLNSGTADIWCAKRLTDATSPNFKTYYTTQGNSNYFELMNETLNETISSMTSKQTLSKKQDYLDTMWSLIMDAAIQVPVCQMKQAVVFNTKTISVNSLKTISGFYGLIDDICSLRLAVSGEIETEPAAETEPPVTEPETTTADAEESLSEDAADTTGADEIGTGAEESSGEGTAASDGAAAEATADSGEAAETSTAE